MLLYQIMACFDLVDFPAMVRMQLLDKMANVE